MCVGGRRGGRGGTQGEKFAGRGETEEEREASRLHGKRMKERCKRRME